MFSLFMNISTAHFLITLVLTFFVYNYPAMFIYGIYIGKNYNKIIDKYIKVLSQRKEPISLISNLPYNVVIIKDAYIEAIQNELLFQNRKYKSKNFKPDVKYYSQFYCQLAYFISKKEYKEYLDWKNTLQSNENAKNDLYELAKSAIEVIISATDLKAELLRNEYDSIRMDLRKFH